MPQNSGL